MDEKGVWPQLAKNDPELEKDLEDLLTKSVAGNPYADDGEFARNLSKLPVGLRAMGATHWLDISLTLDSICWHFGNFGEPGLVIETEAGLRELKLHSLADCFVEARDLMVPLLAARKEDDDNLYEMLERAGLRDRADEIDRKSLDNLGPGESVIIYQAWLRYTRKHPERVFGAPEQHEAEESGFL